MYVTLGHAACEAAAAVFHVLEPHIGAEQRLLRGATLLLDEAAVRVDTVRVLPVAPSVAATALTEATDRIQSLQDLIAGAGVTTVGGGPARLRFADGGPELPRQAGGDHPPNTPEIRQPRLKVAGIAGGGD